MPLDIRTLLKEAGGRNYALHESHVNPQFAKMLRAIGYDRCYVRAEGPYLWDDKGRKYLDMLAGYGMFNFGRNNPAIRKVLLDFIALDYPSLVQLEAPLLSGLLAEELKKRVGRGLDIVYFTNSGTEGTETAIKFAHGATGKPVILYCERAFHGLSTGSLALNGCASFREGFDPLPPFTREVAFDDLNALEDALKAGDVAAFIVESVQGKGIFVPSPGYLAEAARLCHRYGALFVADEVQAGMGRTGRFLGIDHDENVEADIVILSKSLSGGYVPVGALLTRREIYDAVFSNFERAVIHSSTFGQGSLAMVAGLASLAEMDESGAPANAQAMGNKLREGLEAIAGRSEFIKEIRQRGLMVGVEFQRPRSFGLRTAWDMIHRMKDGLFPQAVAIPLLDDHAILTQVAGHRMDVIKLIPPLTIGEADVEWFLDAFETAMRNLHRFPGPVWELLTKLGGFAVSASSRRKVA